MCSSDLKLRQQGIDLSRKALDYFGKGQAVYGSNSAMRKDTGWTMPTGGKLDGQEDLTWLL